MSPTNDEQYPILPMRKDVLLPGVVTPIDVGREKSIKAIDAAFKDDSLIVVVPQHRPSIREPKPEDLLPVGVLAEITQVIKHSAKRYTVMLKCIERHIIEEFTLLNPFYVAITSSMEASKLSAADTKKLAKKTKEFRVHLASVLGEADEEDLQKVSEEVARIETSDHLVDLAAAHLELSRDTLLLLLEEQNSLTRLDAIAPEIAHFHNVLTMKANIDTEIETEISQTQREKVLRDRLKDIREELGEVDESAEVDEFRERLADSKMHDEARKAAKRQIRRLQDMSPSSPEYSVSRTYIENLLDFPWQKTSEDTLDVPAARAILNAKHSGLEKVKKRILEFIAVRKLAPDKQGPILCLVGPPGVGKTSLGRSIATALNRKYVRAALGGVRDEAEIRGHRRTYIGSMPGRIVNSLKKAETSNPVFVLDEIDKLGSGQRGDPASALLEVLDPEQNSEFVDHYLEVPVDLSKVMFWATANNLDTIPRPLLDRMEIIHVPGYTVEEKLEIGINHLVPRQLAEHGLEDDLVQIPSETIHSLITNYTREAGVRNLEREIEALCRNAAVRIADTKQNLVIQAKDLEEMLGPKKFTKDSASRRPEVGVITGLCWTPTGGDILFIEAKKMPGKGNRKITGQLGDVMSESVQTALSWVRSHSNILDIDPEIIETHDIHVHLPQGAVKKDGPSAGCALVCALASLLTDKPLRHDIAITGEVTLRGRALPVGGIKEKLLAAHRAGITTVVLPKQNERDLIDIPDSVKDELTIHLVETVEEVWEIATSPVPNSKESQVLPLNTKAPKETSSIADS